MANYMDGYVFPIPKDHLITYKNIAEQVALIWKEFGALDYVELVDDDLRMEGTRSFRECIPINENEVIIFGWINFDSKESRDEAHKKVASDPRMVDLIAPLLDPSNLIFDAERMVFGGFNPLVG